MMLQPAIYKLVKREMDKCVWYRLEYLYPNYSVPSKLYGDLEEKAIYTWNSFVKSNKSMGILATGTSGQGKTLFCKLFCNTALSMGLPVIIVTEQRIDEAIIQFLSNLDNCVIFLDEFGKMVTGHITQEAMLTMLTDTNKTRRVFLLTDNHTGYINRYILNRPERIKYHLEFTTLKPSVIKAYCKDEGVPEEFVKDILRLAQTNTEFCFDHLVHLVQEAKYSNNYSLPKLLELLNVKAMKLDKFTKPLYITKVDDDSIQIPLVGEVTPQGINYIPIANEVYKAYDEHKTASTGVKNINNVVSRLDNMIYKNTNAKELSEAEINFIDQLVTDYEEVSVTKDPRDDSYFGPPRKTMTGAPFVKVNIQPEYIDRSLDDENMIVYRDVTGKYDVYIKTTNKLY